MKRWKKAACGFVALGTVASLATPAGAATDVPNTNDDVSRVQISGSDTTYLVMQNLGKAYMESEGCVLNAVATVKPITPSTIPQQNRCAGATVPEGASGASQLSAVKTENYDHDVVINYFPQGSNAGRAQLCAQLPSADPLRLVGLQVIDIARSSSAPGSGFQCTGATLAPVAAVGTRILRFVAFAKDALTWVKWDTLAGGSDGVTDLTVQQIKDIWFNCSITTWNQVGGANSNPIIVWTMIAASGSRSTWDGFVGGNSTTCIPTAFKDGNLANGERVIREHFAQPIEAATNDPGAADEGNSISPFSVGLHNTQPALAQSSLLGNVNAIAPSEVNIVDGTFPFTRLLYNVYINAGPSPIAGDATRRFASMRNWSGPAQNEQLGWICKPLNSHAKPIEGDPGVGIATAGASFNYAGVVDNALRSTGFYPLTTDITLPRCTFTDYRTDAAAQVFVP